MPATTEGSSWARRRCGWPGTASASRPCPSPTSRPPPTSTRTGPASSRPWGATPALPAPRRVTRPPFVQFQAPTVWTTLALTLHADGRTDHELVGASPFPRHWVYGPEGELTAKAGLADFKDWYRHAFGRHTPWGEGRDAGHGDRGGDGARAGALGDHHARRGAGGGEEGEGGRGADPSGRARAGRSSCCWTGCSPSRSTVKWWPRSGRGPSWASERCSRPGRGPRRCGRCTRAKVAAVHGDQIDRAKLAELSSGHRREDEVGEDQLPA